MTSLLSVDIGTSSVKGALISVEGELTYGASSRYTQWQGFYYYDKFPVELWCRSFFKVLNELIVAARGDILAITISANAPSLVALNAKGNVLEPVLHHLARGERSSLNTESFYLDQLLNFKVSYPLAYQETHCFLTISEYFVWLLTGVKATASPFEAYDKYFWQKKELEEQGLDPLKMAPFVRTTTCVGKTLGHQGEPMGIPVVLGGIDYLSTLLGTDSTVEGVITDRAGTSEALNLCARINKTYQTFYCLPQLPEGLINIGATLGSTGIVLERARYLGRTVVSLREVFMHINALGPHHNVFYLTNKEQFWQYSSENGIYKGNSEDHEVWNLALARLEAIGFSLRAVQEVWSAQGLSFKQNIRLTGGQARLPAWNQLKANLIGKPLELLSILDAELLGNAILAQKGLGIIDDLKDACKRLVKIARTIEPETHKMQFYKEKYEQFKYLSLKHQSQVFACRM